MNSNGAAPPRSTHAASPLGSGCRNRFHPSRRKQFADAFRLERPQIFVPANEAKRRAATVDLRQPVEVPQQQQLVEEIMFVPEHDLVVGAIVVERVVPGHFTIDVFLRSAERREEVRGAGGSKTRGRDVRHRAVVEHVRPHGDLSRHARAFQVVSGGVPVQHVQHQAIYTAKDALQASTAECDGSVERPAMRERLQRGFTDAGTGRSNGAKPSHHYDRHAQGRSRWCVRRP
jgi:hypothetical protein